MNNLELLSMSNTMSLMDVEAELVKLEERFSVEETILEDIEGRDDG